jgi:hypothetical protein
VPLVRGTIAGHSTTLIVDTGAHIPFVSSWLAREAGLALGQPIVGRDSGGRATPMRETDHASLVIEDFGAVADGPVAVGDLPDAFRRVGVGALVSPQALATPNEVVILDLVAGRMRVVPRAEAPAPESRAPTSKAAFVNAHLCTYHAGTLRARSLVATIIVDGAELVLDLDTGATGITVDSASDIGKRLAARPSVGHLHGLGATGAFDVVAVDDVPVRIGELEDSVRVGVATGAGSAACGVAGRIGVDYLKGCILVIGHDTLSASCQPPPISTGNGRCDECMHAHCREPAAECRRAPTRCAALSICAKACETRACIDECATKSPSGMHLQRCLADSCREACGP